MNDSSRHLPAVLLALSLPLLLAIGGPAWAAAGGVLAPQAVTSVTVRDEVSLSEAVAQVKREYGGRILEAETREKNGRRVHVIKVLTREGRVRTVRISAGGDR